MSAAWCTRGFPPSLSLRHLRAYWSTFRARGRVLLQYREAALAGVVTQLFWGGIRIMIFEAFYRSTSSAQPLSYQQTVTYLWLIQALLLLLPWHVDPEAAASIRTAAWLELARPVDLYLVLVQPRAWRRACCPVLMRPRPFLWWHAILWSATARVVGGGLGRGGGLAEPRCWRAAITMLATHLAAVERAGDGVSRFWPTLASVLSGSIVPLPFTRLGATGAERLAVSRLDGHPLSFVRGRPADQPGRCPCLATIVVDLSAVVIGRLLQRVGCVAWWCRGLG